ncbi:MAG: ABC transporter ATP-binding protein [Magnetococcales bacterium]|nr:ABC transporter ATP-binding protein [Magnetococcales bacterium]
MTPVAGESIIRVEGVWKRYGLPLMPIVREGWHRLRGAFGFPGEAPPILPWALREVSFEVRAGETLGLIGRNGAGKSTLLKILAGVSPPSAGQVWIDGTLFPMIELNAGIHMELTGRENVYLLGAVMGLSREEVTQRMGDIEGFCELGEWFDRPVRMYSSGMQVRLGFGVGLFVNADVLLMDEVMGVGDVNFYNKCLMHLEDVRSRGRCILFVSHNLFRVRRLCDRVVVLDRGEVKYVGRTEEGIQVYEEILRAAVGGGRGAGRFYDLVGATLVSASLRDMQGGVIETVVQGEPVDLDFTFRLAEKIEILSVHVMVESVEGVLVIWDLVDLERLLAGDNHFLLRWSEIRLKPGVYAVSFDISTGPFRKKGFHHHGVLSMRVAGPKADGGVYQPHSDFRLLEHRPLVVDPAAGGPPPAVSADRPDGGETGTASCAVGGGACAAS